MRKIRNILLVLLFALVIGICSKVSVAALDIEKGQTYTMNEDTSLGELEGCSSDNSSIIRAIFDLSTRKCVIEGVGEGTTNVVFKYKGRVVEPFQVVTVKSTHKEIPNTNTSHECYICKEGNEYKSHYILSVDDGSFRSNSNCYKETVSSESQCTDKAQVKNNEIPNTEGTGSKKTKKNDPSGGNSIKGLEGDDYSGIPSMANKLFALDADNEIEGQVCSHFAVCPGRFVTPSYYHKQNTLIYPVETRCANDPNQYVSFCVDPGYDGIYDTDGCTDYSAQPLDMTTNCGRWMYSLYRLYKEEGASDDATIVKYQDAARFIQFWEGSECPSNKSFTNRKGAILAPLYKSKNAGEIGTLAAEGLDKAREAIERSDEYAAEAKASSLGLVVQQLGTFDYTDGNNFITKINVTIQNYANVKDNGGVNFDENAPFTFNVEGSGTYNINPTPINREEVGNDLIYTFEMTGTVNSDDCSDIKLTVEMAYHSANDIGHAYRIEGSNPAIAQNKQAFYIFAEQGADIKKQAETMLNPGNTACEKEMTACPTNFAFVCGVDGQEVVLNEGAVDGGETNWEDCIIGHTDERGNSYDIVDTSTRVVPEEEALDQTSINNIEAFLSDGTEVLSAHYCKISCKEKYTFKLPGGKKEVRQGTWFGFEVPTAPYVVGVGAERDCVSTNVDNNTFNSIVLDLRKQQIDYLNMYSYYKALYIKMNKKETQEIYRDEYHNNGISQMVEVSNVNSEGKMNSDYSGDSQPDWLEENYKYTKKKFEGGQAWSKAWDGVNGTGDGVLDMSDVEIPFYRIINPDDIKSELELDKMTINAANLSFREALSQNGRIPNVGSLDKYANIYPDYIVYDYKMLVEESYDITDPPEVYYYLVGFSNSSGCPARYKSCNKINRDGCDENGENCSPYTEYTGQAIEAQEFTVKHTAEEEMGKYNAMLEELKKRYTLALEKYKALTKQINAQADGMQQCTNNLNTISQENSLNNVYKFDPQITFAYDQDNYMAQMSPNLLVPAAGKINDPTESLYYCASDPGSGQAVFESCSGGSEEKIEFNFLIEFDDPGEETIIPNMELDDVIDYYNVARVGSRITYAVQEFQSATQFWTYPNDGLAVNRKVENSTIIGGDKYNGYVFPVAITTEPGQHPYSLTFKNIGQFFGRGSLGRLMGGSSINSAVYQGEMQDVQVCWYDVCRVDDPNCPDPNGPKTCRYENGKYYCLNGQECSSEQYLKECNCDPNTDPNCPSKGVCDDIKRSDVCNNGKISSMSPAQVKACIDKLVTSKEADGTSCCTIADEVKNANFGKLGRDQLSLYYSSCFGECTSFNIANYTGTSSITNISDLSKAANEGKLQFTARSVSLNNLFPNGSVNSGTNWQAVDGNASYANTIVNSIQSKGESIYGEDPEYAITLTPTCMAAIRSYNNQQERNNEGGFNDFTGMIDNTNLGEARPGSVSTSDGFREFLEQHSECKYTWSDKIDVIPELKN